MVSSLCSSVTTSAGGSEVKYVLHSASATLIQTVRQNDTIFPPSTGSVNAASKAALTQCSYVCLYTHRLDGLFDVVLLDSQVVVWVSVKHLKTRRTQE